jgi:hypothetical protein
MKVSQLSLVELYSKEKITPSIEKAILEKESFSSISPDYCRSVCKLKCKSPSFAKLLSIEVDVLIIQENIALPGKYDRAPGQQERIQMGVIKHLTDNAGMSGLTYRVIPLLKCELKPQDLKLGKPPAATTLLKCKPYLWEEIRRSKPRVILSLGTAVTKALGFKRLSNGRNRGAITRLSQGDYAHTLPDIPVVLSAHPKILSMIRQNAQGSGMWGSDYYNVILRDFQKANDLARGLKELPDLVSTIKFYKENRITFCKSVADVQACMDRIAALPESAVLSFDTETNTLDAMAVGAKLLTIQFGWRDPASGQIVAAVIPLNHRKNLFYKADEAWPLIAPMLEGSRPKVAHNGKFDILMIYWTMGTRVRNLKFDTMLMLHSISSGNQGCYGLKAAAWDFLWDLGFAGYEDLLPSLKDVEVDTDSDAEAFDTTA